MLCVHDLPSGSGKGEVFPHHCFALRVYLTQSCPHCQRSMKHLLIVGKIEKGVPHRGYLKSVLVDARQGATVRSPFGSRAQGFYLDSTVAKRVLIRFKIEKRSGDPNPQYFSKSIAVQMGAYCRTNGGRTAVQMGGVLQDFPFFEA